MNDAETTGKSPAETNPETLTRRQVLKTAAGLALLLPMAAVALADVAPAAKKTWTTVGKAGDFVKNHPKRVTPANGVVLYVTRLAPDKPGADKFAVVSAKCTHQGCEVAWQAADSKFHCPCHGSVFASSGKNVKGTRRSPDEKLPNLPMVAARQKNGQVQVSLPAGPEDDLKPIGG